MCHPMLDFFMSGLVLTLTWLAGTATALVGLWVFYGLAGRLPSRDEEV